MALAVPKTTDVAEAFAYCERLAKNHYENFTVVSWFFPKALRPSMFSIYAFCRRTDDLGDEAEGDRLQLLDQWEADLRRCYDGTPEDPALIALQRTIIRHEIPPDPFLKLIQANRMDQLSKRYPTFQDVLHYCEHSANPVGHMVLFLFGYHDAERRRLADMTCTALQLANFWQDVRRDHAMGRIYLPLDDMKRFGYTEQMLQAAELGTGFRELMAFEVERTRGLFAGGARLVNLVESELRLDLKLFTAGGLAVLDAIERQEYDVLSRRPVVSKARKARLAMSALAGLGAQRLFGRNRHG